MKIANFKTFENLYVPNIDIPNDTAKWCTLFHLSPHKVLYNKPIITPEMLSATNEVLADYCDGYLYRGITMDELDLKAYKKMGYVETLYTPSSWTWDEQTARTFAFPYGDYGLILKYPVDKLKKYFAMDVVMQNVKKAQLSSILTPAELEECGHYISESEIVVLDNDMHIPFTDIEILKPIKKDKS